MKKTIISTLLLLALSITASAKERNVSMEFHRKNNPPSTGSVDRAPMRISIDVTYDTDTRTNDIIRYFKEVGVYSEPLANNNLVKNEMKKMAKQFAQLTLSNTQQSGTAEHLVNSQCDYLRSKCKVTADELKLYKDFTLRIADKSSVLSESELHRYANELNLIIDDPRLSNEVKRDLAVSAMTTINSSLCWQQ